MNGDGDRPSRARAVASLAAIALPFAFARAASADDADAKHAGAADVVGREVAAYNAHDAATVVKLHAATASLTLLPQGTTLAAGSDALLAFFTKGFANAPAVALALRGQIVLKNVVVNHYDITGSALREIVSIYDVRDGLIANEWVVIG